ncbi:MAG: DUF2062 domain-containing protein [Alphaproteobacteria bacterium]
MFQRRIKMPMRRRVREWLWPSSGWRRSMRYAWHRVRRLKDSPSSIAAGVACGAAIAFTPFVGFHFVLSAIFAWIVRGNIIASAIGTAVVGNPWALPVIWMWTYRLGHWMMGTHNGRALPRHLELSYAIKYPWDVLVPMTLGSLVTGAVVWIIIYALVWMEIQRLQRVRHKRLARGLAARAADRSKREAT